MPSTEFSARAEHRVTFYRSAEYVAAHLTAFVESGLLAGQTVFVIAPPERHADLKSRLDQKPRRRPLPSPVELVCLDACELVDQIAPGGKLDFAATNQVMATILQHAPRVRAYGELAPVLARRGYLEAALQLESLGHYLAHGADVPVLCGYDAAHLSRDTRDADRIADVHDRAIAESAADLSPVRPSVLPLVLLADDVGDGREMYGEYLRYAGFRVLTAGDGAEAVHLAEVYLPDVIFMDVRMPHVNGIAAMKVLKADPRLARTPIIALTAHAQDGERAEMLAEGFDDVVAKPCLPDRLVLAIRAVVGL
jgi:two-component system, cell cycle response regulator DivK